MLQGVGKWAVPQVVGTGETPPMVGTRWTLQVAGTGACPEQEMQATLVVDRRATPPGDKRMILQVGETEETPRAVGRGATLRVAVTDVTLQVVEMWAIPRVAGRGVTLQGGAAVASPHFGGSPVGAQAGPLLSLQTQDIIFLSSPGTLPTEHTAQMPLTTEEEGTHFTTLKSYSPSGLASHCRGPGSLGCIEVTCPPFGCPWHATYRASGSSVRVSPPGSGGENLQRVQGSRHYGSCQSTTTRQHSGAGLYCPSEPSPPKNTFD